MPWQNPDNWDKPGKGKLSGQESRQPYSQSNSGPKCVELQNNILGIPNVAASQLPDSQTPRIKTHPETTNKKPQIYEEHRADLQGWKLRQSMRNMRSGQTN